MHGTTIIGTVLGLAVLLVSSSASAEPGREAPLFPVEGGYMLGVGKDAGEKPFQAAIISTGAGIQFERIGLMAFGRAGMGPDRTRLGWGGVRGYLAAFGNDWFEIGPDLALSAGAGRDRGRKTGLLAAVEPGLSMRFATYAAGGFELKANWYQPLFMGDQSWRGAMMFTLAWQPFYSTWM